MIDTNVLAVADGMYDDASEACVGACRVLVARITSGLRVAVDADDLILAEYVSTLKAAKSGGAAKKLAERLWRTRQGAGICRVVTITPLDEPLGSYAEVPPDLRDFDADDQKFLAVASAEGNTPPVFQALDHEWWERRADLTAAGIDVQFLCSTDLLGDAG